MAAPTLPPERAQFLEDVDLWQAYAGAMNDKAVAAGIVSRATVEANRRRTEAAQRALLSRWSA